MAARSVKKIMQDILTFVVILAVYLGLQYFVLPKLGVPT